MKVSVYLDEADKRRLAEHARTTGTSEAALLRQGLRLVLAQAERPRLRLGTGESADGRPARDSDALLHESGFGES